MNLSSERFICKNSTARQTANSIIFRARFFTSLGQKNFPHQKTLGPRSFSRAAIVDEAITTMYSSRETRELSYLELAMEPFT